MDGISIAGRKVKSGFDFYQTPSWATEELLKRETFSKTIWECASGSGAITKVLKEKGYKVVENDIRNDGVSFLNRTGKGWDIITNPPYNLATEFVEHAIKQSDNKVAMFLKLSFLESARRYKLFTTTPLKYVYVFSKRVNLYPEGKEIPKNSGTIAYAWYIWEKKYKEEPIIRWIK